MHVQEPRPEVLQRLRELECRRRIEANLEQALRDTFPASDPISIYVPTVDEIVD